MAPRLKGWDGAGGGGQQTLENTTNLKDFFFLFFKLWQTNKPHTIKTPPSLMCANQEYRYYTMSLSQYHMFFSIP